MASSASVPLDDLVPSSSAPSSSSVPTASSGGGSQRSTAATQSSTVSGGILSAIDVLNVADDGDGAGEEENENGRDGDGGDDDYWTVAELLKELIRAFLDESSSPKLLPEKLEMADKMVVQMAQIDKIIVASSSKNSLTCSAHRMELYRTEHIVNSYLRVRLRKIEQNPALALRDHSERVRRALQARRTGKRVPEQPALLEAREVQFAQRLLHANGALLRDTFLSLLPASMQHVPVPLTVSSGSQRVFVEVLKDNLDRVSVPSMADPNSDLLVSLDKGTRHMLPFHCVEELLDQGHVRLL
uniref:DNA replication complex GINS protein SLD5 n=1 Tax=Globodera rostochiensis TaxID=31243 RepID=A0A914GTS3_GLORO